MSEKRRGLGRGIGALIPSGPTQTATASRPADMFFQPSSTTASSGDEAVVDLASPDAAPTAADPAPTADGPSAARKAANALMQPSKAAKSRSASAAKSRKTAPAKSGSGASPATADALTTPTAQAEATESAASELVNEAAPVVVTPAEPTGGAATRSPAAAPDAGGARAETSPAEVGSETAEDDGLVPVPGATFAELPINAIVPNTRQPRQIFDEEELDELAVSIREVGVLQPVVVRPLTAPIADSPEAQYELIMGERRWRASEQAGNDTVPAIIRDTSDGNLLRDALLENLHRADLNPLEEAAAYSQLLEDFGCTHDELGARIARSRPQISNTLRLLKLPPLVQRRVAAGVLSAGHARALLGLSDGAAMERLAQRIVAEGLSVRVTEEIVALGDEPVAPEMRRRPRAGAHSEVLNHVAARLADRFDTRVKVNLGQRKGRIAIEFASMDDLTRILDVLAPGEAPVVADQGFGSQN
ncbi:ParB/RepB/Spo0J family partition protein [Georgenia yuyongxinii]|uniref:ParB/RepB/Spo0J family partition protein n=1 Tax=Georgenia yuyongxinii TaxID=2589797 RepID=A0A552WPY1_9MICO|nr:ParB/RepB/Spo0J family partition protein [Georgenia yuyongxinii]TRW44841.1 ParB/RepB/Spo0J family partition protein [Georgenia yuyongxinii]